MPKIVKVSGGQSDLRVTRRERRQLSKNRFTDPCVRVKCGCCNEVVEIFHDDNLVSLEHNSLEINGVNGSIEQWRQVLLPLLGLQPVPEVSGVAKEGLKLHWESQI